MVVQTGSLSSVTVMVAPASPVPLTSGVRSSVIGSVGRGLHGHVVAVSTVTVTVASGEVLLASSVAVAA